MKGMGRALPAFAVGFGGYYAPAFQFNWPMFTYFPAVNGFVWGWAPGSETVGPPMHWYGWMAYGVIVGLVLAGLALLLPAKRTEKVWAVLCWVVPLASILWLGYVERQFFM